MILHERVNEVSNLPTETSMLSGIHGYGEQAKARDAPRHIRAIAASTGEGGEGVRCVS